MKQSLLGLLDLLNCLIFPDKVTLGAMVALHLSLIGGPVIGAAKPVVPTRLSPSRGCCQSLAGLLVSIIA